MADYSNLPSLEDRGIKTGSTAGAKNFVAATAGIQIIGNIASTMANVSAFKANVKADADQRILNMNNVMDSFEYTSNKLKEAHQVLDSKFSDKVSERLLTNMKDMATARVMAAESGGTTSDIESGIKADEMFDVAMINAQRRRSLGDIHTQREQSRMNAVNQVKSLASGGFNVRANSMVSALSGATNSLGSLLMTMPKDVRAEMFSMNTQGTKTNIVNSKPQGL